MISFLMTFRLVGEIKESVKLEKLLKVMRTQQVRQQEAVKEKEEYKDPVTDLQEVIIWRKANLVALEEPLGMVRTRIILIPTVRICYSAGLK